MIDRRGFVLGTAAAGFVANTSAFGQANWPDRTIRIIVPFAAGSFTDIAARLLAAELSDRLGQSVIVENRGGAGSNTGTATVARSPADGYTLLVTDTSLATSPGLYKELPYDALRDLAQISRLATSPTILLVSPALGPRSLPELIAYAKQNPDKLNFGSGGVGSSAHLGMELLLDTAGIKARHVPFRGVAAAIQEAMAGRIDMVIASLASGVAQVQGHTLLGMAVTGEQRSPLLPDVPTFAQAGLAKFQMMYWWDFAAPAGTPSEVIDRLNREVRRACDQPRLRDAFTKQAATPAPSSPDEMKQALVQEIELWRGVIARANISPQ